MMLQVAPAELENVIRKHPDVVEAAVIGIPDDLAGEVPRAFVALTPGSTTTSQDIVKYVEPIVSSHKRLAGGVIITDNIPRSATGKLLRRELKKAALS